MVSPEGNSEKGIVGIGIETFIRILLSHACSRVQKGWRDVSKVLVGWRNRQKRGGDSSWLGWCLSRIVVFHSFSSHMYLKGLWSPGISMYDLFLHQGEQNVLDHMTSVVASTLLLTPRVARDSPHFHIVSLDDESEALADLIQVFITNTEAIGE